MHKKPIRTNSILEGVRYEIRGELAHRAMELERQGYEIISLNIGNPGLFGFRTPETMRLAMIENLGSSEPYCHQKGIFPAREAVVMQQQSRGILDVTAEDVFIGNGVSELIDLTLRALLNGGVGVLYEAAAALDKLSFEIVDLPDNLLGRELHGTAIRIDVDAAGQGWFVDSTPADDSEFLAAADSLLSSWEKRAVEVGQPPAAREEDLPPEIRRSLESLGY